MDGEIQQFTEELAESLGLEDDLHPDENEIYTLNLGEGLIIQYADLNPGLDLVSYLEKLPEENLETFLMALMRVNLFGRGTGGCVLGYDLESRFITHKRALPYALKYRDFKEAIEDFVNYVEFWKEQIAKIKRGEKSLLDF